MSKMQDFQKAASDAREAYLDELADVAWLALYEAGAIFPQRGPEWERLRDAIRFATT